MPLEQEVKLAYPDIEAARRAVETAGGRLVVSRRLIDDQFFDTHDRALRRAGQVLRIRQDGIHVVLTWKGPSRHDEMVKTREEIETECADHTTLAAVLGALGYVPHFRAQKYRTDYAIDTATVTIDEAPMGVFIEVEADPPVIAAVTARLGRTAADYELASYATLWRRWCDVHGQPFGDMTFDSRHSTVPHL